MKTRKLVGAGFGALVLGGALAGVTFAVERAPKERIVDIDVVAVVTADGDVDMTETIRWDFDTAQRRGIFRIIPVTAPDARANGRSTIVPVLDAGVASPSAPGDLSITSTFAETNLRIGNPNITNSGQHDYRITYRLGRLVDPVDGGERGFLALNAVGDQFEVPIDQASVTVVLPGPLVEVDCFIGAAGSTGRCVVDDEALDDGTTLLTIEADSLGTGVGISVEATYDAPQPPGDWWTTSASGWRTTSGAPPDISDLGPQPPPTPGPAAPGVLFVGFPLLVLAGVALAWSRIRRLGRDVRWAGSSVNAVFAGSGPTQSVSDTEARSLVTIAFTPPRGVRPGEGASLWRLRVTDTDRVATLVDLAIRGWLVIDETDVSKPVLRWKGGDGTDQLEPDEQAFLEGIFQGQYEVQLGTYDKRFASAWAALGTAIDQRVKQRDWLRHGESGRKTLGVLGGFALVGVGLVWCLVGATLRWPSESSLSWAVLLPGALLFALGMGCWFGSTGLRARSPEGFSVWAQVEGFRRFMEGSEGEHAREAAERGVLRQYVAWAVALDEVERWDRACAAAGVNPTEGWMVGSAGLYVGLGSLNSTVSASHTAPSSSGGGGGGSVGGGGGGGGGGSW